MIHKVSPDLENLLRPIDNLLTLPKNPRKGNLASIVASYDEFGQVKPIVAVDNNDETLTVIAGNHQLAAAKELGWTHMAVLAVPFDHEKAIAFALADNRTSELGEDDQGLLQEMLMSVVEEMPQFFEELGWDDFEIATFDPVEALPPVSTSNDGWTAPTLITDMERENPPPTVADEETMKSLVTQGATATDSAGAKAVVQYTLVFNDADQQAEWYAFLRYLKSHPDYMDIPTTAAQVTAFITNKIATASEQ